MDKIKAQFDIQQASSL